jgi:methylmalonyl-CoA mutase N-terminal domain/subunit
VTLQALSAVLGGTQSLHTNGFDEALGLPTEEAAQTALRTQQIIAFESGVADTADPLAGSYYVESLTAEMEEKILAIMDDIEALGGSVRAIEEGYMQEQIATSAYNYQLAIESGKKTVVGLNAFVQTGEKEIPILRIDESIRAQQIQKINTLKQSRDAKRVNEALEMITICASSKMNLMPAVMEAVDCQCTLGEISDTLRQVFGEYRQ